MALGGGGGVLGRDTRVVGAGLVTKGDGVSYPRKIPELFVLLLFLLLVPCARQTAVVSCR